jgi:gamma-glutamyl:cysteine ligase YbdK (ATP-grasp superfamily)
VEILLDIFKLVAAVGGFVFAFVKWLLERNKKNELKESYEKRLVEKDNANAAENKLYEKLIEERDLRILELERKKKKLEKIIGK